ncbi:related to RMD8 - cytosolic protein required for sporulation [Cephalotrichum gorgonifer]|uniref:Related to RMD8 - cytosolic protein required for sporulation n=1 Tax=Cephalotrichum gorgonifer TaxID=2041049 RepID=A0AAE8N9F6_9PEZI|nr:related to RMD8 - cytosolic protein required for sporulation [Cephalotrichum gorgonifer]
MSDEARSSSSGPEPISSSDRPIGDAGAPPPQPAPGPRPVTGNMRNISVDRVLQGSSDIPSAHPRGPPRPRPLSRHSQQAQQHLQPARRAVSGGPPRGIPSTTSRTGQHIPARTTKLSEKLVLLPEADDPHVSDEDIQEELSLSRRYAEADDHGPLKDEERDVLRKRGGIRGKSYAERLPKVQRTAEVSRMTAYCTAQAFKMRPTAEFLRRRHDARTKLYDDCLYVIYALPLLPGSDGYRVKSRAILRTPGTGKTVVDLEIERSEQGDRSDPGTGYFDDFSFTPPEDGQAMNSNGNGLSPGSEPPSFTSPHHPAGSNFTADAKSFAEMFVFSYGVVVFWNFTESQERDILADLTFAENETGESLLSHPLEHDDYEAEEFHFEYSSEAKRPRIFNDMITLLPRFDHMVKLTISHAIAQSTKLCFFEERMSATMIDAQHVPKDLALTGELEMGRTEVVKILGRLFKSRVEINLSSNVLDVPKFFWDSEPTLHPLYAAIREYLEIDHRTKTLNDRCRVFLDLAEVLSDSVADSKMSNITWIIIILIGVSIVVTVSEVVLRFSMLEKSKGEGDRERERARLGPGNVTAVAGEGPAMVLAGERVHLGSEDDVLREVKRLVEGMGAEELRRWRAVLSADQMEGICGGEREGELRI